MATDGVSRAELRLRAITSLRLLDRVGDPALAGLTRLATYLTGARAAAVHILDDVYQRRLATVNAPLVDHPLHDSMCRLVIEGGERIVCTDATLDGRFAYSSFVAGDAPVRFYASVPLRVSDGAVVGTLCAFDTSRRSVTASQVLGLEDLAAQAVTHVELMRIAGNLGDAASRDPLTGTVNRLLLDDRLEQALRRSTRTGASVLLVIADVDDFKAFNDRYGHGAGDEILKGVADRLRSCARAEDTVARMGGDEFAFVAELSGGPAGAGVIIDRLREALLTPGWDAAPQVTLGAALGRPGDDPRALLDRADAAMYSAKPRRRGLAAG